jgi:hypothetical protein
VRNTLVTALVSCADRPLKLRARRFLMGLSSDELQFIAEFLGACILESDQRRYSSSAQLAERVERFHGVCSASTAALEDRDHKIILLKEYLGRAGGGQFSPALAAGQTAV